MISPHFPFAPARLPFFYGWVIVAVSTVGVVLSIPGQTMGVSVFTDYLIRDLGLSRDALSSAYMGGTMTSAAILPFAGLVFDRLGARWMTVIASLALGATLLFLSASDRIAALLSRQLATASASNVKFAVLCVGFFALRFWGQGVLTMVSRAMLGKWFDRRRGFASAISGVFVSASFSVAPVVLLAHVTARGWRGAWVDLAALYVVWAFLGWLLCRDNPEECDLRMDGRTAARRPESKSPPELVRDFTLLEALKSYSFWIASLSLALLALVSTGLTFHITSIGAKDGLRREEAVAIFVPMAVVSVTTNFVSGWLSDRIRIRNLFWVLLAGIAVGSGALSDFGSARGRVFVVGGFGVASGLFALLMTVIWPRFFGRAHLGSISAVSMAMTVLGSAIGPKIFALSEARDGRYDSSFTFGVISALILMVATVGVENPQRRRDSP